SPQRQREEVLPVAALAAASATDAELVKALSLLKSEPGRSPAAWEVALLEGLGDGLRSGQRSLARLLETPPPALKDAAARVRPFFESATAPARSGKRPFGERLAAVRLLGHGPYPVGGPALRELLSPRQPPEVQLAAIRALAQHDNPSVAKSLLAAWPGYS